jgi:hypothetical protein
MVVVLHAGWREGRLLLWGEAPGGGARRPAAGRGRGARRVEPYAFDAGAAALGAVKAAGVQVAAKAPGAFTAWLPAVAGEVIPSSALVGEAPGSRGKAGLVARRVSGLALACGEAADLLGACAGKDMLAPGIVIGADLAWWSDACRLAGSIVARQQYLPDVVMEDGEHRARWVPAWSADDARATAALAGRMPGVARAIAAEDSVETAAPARAADEVVREFIGAIVDCLVREGAGDSPRFRGRRRGQPPARANDGTHEQWVKALLDDDGRMEGTNRELAALQEEVRSWRRPVALGAAAPLRLCLRLEEPRGDGSARKAAKRSWQVKYLLQPLDDPSLLLPAREVWGGGGGQGRGRGAAILKRGGAEPREFLLASLGQAASLCPRIEQSLRRAQPEGYELDGSGAHEFLTQRAAALESAGFGVMLPAWWTRKGTKLRLAARAGVRSPKMTADAGLSLDALVEVQWDVALGDEKLSRAELEELAALKEPLVQVRGQWVELSAEEIKAAVSFWKGKKDGDVTLGQVLRMALGAGAGAGGAPGGLELGGVDASGWIGELLGQLQDRSGF